MDATDHGNTGSLPLRRAWLALLLVPLLMGADVYRWVDENGVVNYTQLSPRDTNAQLIRTRAGRPSEAIREVSPTDAVTVNPTPDQPPELTPEQQRRLDEMQAAERARQAEIARIRSFNCERSRSVLSDLTSGPRIKVTGPDGVARILPDEELKRRIADAQRKIAENCGPA